MNLGLVMLIEWCWTVRSKIGFRGMLTVYTQVVTAQIYGLLPSVVLGVMVASFSAQYQLMTFSVLKHHLTGDTVHSFVERTDHEQQTLKKRGKEIHVVGLDGYLGEGPMVKLSNYLMKYTEKRNTVKYLILDFRMCFGGNPSACSQLSKLDKKLNARGITTIYVNPDELMAERLQFFGIGEDLIYDASDEETSGDCCCDALEDIEECILDSTDGEMVKNRRRAKLAQAIEDFEKSSDPKAVLVLRLAGYIKCSMEQAERLSSSGTWLQLKKDTVLAEQGVLSTVFYVAIPGLSEVTETLDVGSSMGQNLTTSQTSLGAVSGMLGVFYDSVAQVTCTVSLDGSRVLAVRKDAVAAVLQDDPSLGGICNALIARQLAKRVHAMKATMQTSLGGGWQGAIFDEVTAGGIDTSELDFTLAVSDLGEQRGNEGVVRRASRQMPIGRRTTIDNWADVWVEKRHSAKAHTTNVF